MNWIVSKTAISSLTVLVLVAFAIGCDEPEVEEAGDEVAEEAVGDDFDEAQTDEETQEAPALAAADFPTGEVTLVGTNSCLGCSLSGEHDAHAQCGEYGHDHALKIEYGEDADGQVIDGIAGHTVHFLENDAAADLIEGEEFHGERVKVEGRLLGAAATLEVQQLSEPSEEMIAAADGADVVEKAAADVVITGMNSCLGCDLSGEHDAQAQCSEYGHTHALQIEEMRDQDGDVVDGFAGRIVHYLANDDAASLIQGERFHGEQVQVEGRLFAESSTLEVHDFSSPQAQ